jgi:hypothetical protein
MPFVIKDVSTKYNNSLNGNRSNISMYFIMFLYDAVYLHIPYYKNKSLKVWIKKPSYINHPFEVCNDTILTTFFQTINKDVKDLILVIHNMVISQLCKKQNLYNDLFAIFHQPIADLLFQYIYNDNNNDNKIDTTLLIETTIHCFDSYTDTPMNVPPWEHNLLSLFGGFHYFFSMFKYKGDNFKVYFSNSNKQLIIESTTPFPHIPLHFIQIDNIESFESFTYTQMDNISSVLFTHYKKTLYEWYVKYNDLIVYLKANNRFDGVISFI